MSEARSPEGWEPRVGDEITLEDVIEHAFDYRGDVTIVRTDGRELVGYLFNRNRDVPEPFVQLFDTTGAGPHTLRYADIRTIRFTGRDTAAGSSYAAWLRRKSARTGAAPAADA